MTRFRRGPAIAGVLCCAALAAGTGVAIAHTGGDEGHHGGGAMLDDYEAHATVTVRSIATREVVGMAMLRQHGTSLVAKIVVSGLAPGSRHANHLHGEAVGDPVKGCFAAGGHSTRHIHDNPDLVANSEGTAYALIRAEVSEKVVRKGTFWMIHANPSDMAAGHTGHAATANPGVACAPIR